MAIPLYRVGCSGTRGRDVKVFGVQELTVMPMRNRRIFWVVALSCLGVVGCSDIPSAPVAPAGMVAGESHQPLRTPPGGVTTSSTLSAYIDGTSDIYYPTYYTWAALASGGTGTYSYQWQHRVATSSTWYNVGTNSWTYEKYVGTNYVPFVLRVIVTSGSYSFTSAEFLVRNCQAVDCSEGEI
jgi:hypothetical protein